MSFVFLEVSVSKFILSPASYLLLPSCGFRLIALRRFLFVCVKGGGLCLGVCQGVYMEIGGYRLGVSFLFHHGFRRRLELRPRPAWQAHLPASVGLQSIGPCSVLLAAPPLAEPSAGAKRDWSIQR